MYLDLRIYGFLNFLHCLPDCIVNSSKTGSCVFFPHLIVVSAHKGFSFSSSKKETGQAVQQYNDFIRGSGILWFSSPPWLVCGFHPHDSKWTDPPLVTMAMFKVGRRDEAENKGKLSVVKILSA